MTKHDIEFRQATAADAELFYGKQPMKTMRGMVAVLNGNTVGIGGIYYDNGVMVAFSEMKPELRLRKKDIARGIRHLMHMMDDISGPIFAVAGSNEPTARNLLEKIGFMPSGQHGPLGEILVKVN